MSRVSEILAVTYAARHCAQYRCRKCATRARWKRRKQWRSHKTSGPRRTGRK